MTILTLGDLATSYQQKLHSARLKTQLARLTDEMATGRVSDLRKATGGHFGTLGSLDHQLGSIAAYTTAGKEAALFLGTLQEAFGTIQDAAGKLAPVMLQASDSAHASFISATAADARAQFQSVVSALNTHVADRTLLGGTATGGPALATSETMLADLSAAVTGLTTAADIETAVDAWFDTPGGGFETVGYLGSTTPLSPFRVGQHEAINVQVTAADAEIRDFLKGYAMAALVDLGALSTQPGEKAELLTTAGERLFNANAKLAEVRGRIGSAEAEVDTALARNASAASALELARNDIVAADPYQTAVDLEAAQIQLESLFAITARLSRLTLTEYLR